MRCTTSTARRLRAKQMTRWSRSTSAAVSVAASASGDARSPELGVQQRRVPERDLARGLRRAVDVDHVHLDAGQRRHGLDRVRDGGRRQQELRRRAGDRAGPPQPPQHVGDVCAEDAAIDVRLVDDHRDRGWPARRPSGRGAGRCRRAACPGWSAAGSRAGERRCARRARCRRRTARAAGRCRGRGRTGRAPGPGPGPWSARGRARGRADRPAAAASPAARRPGSCRSPCP